MSVRLQTAIWQEDAEPGDAFATRAARLHGYDVYGSMLGRASWAETILLLLTGERPAPATAALLNDLAVALANPGPRDASVHAAMSSGVSGSPAAATLMAALAAGAGQGGGGRDVLGAMETWSRCGRSIDAWARDAVSPPVERDDTWPTLDHRPGFEPHARTAATITLATLEALAEHVPNGALWWLRDARPELEAATGAPVSMAGVAAAAYVDLGLTPVQGEMLHLLLRLPGAAAHALEQADLGFKAFPWPGVELLDDPPDPRGGVMTIMRPAPTATSPDTAAGPAHPLEAHTGTLRTTVGAAYPGERAVFRGRDIHAEVIHDTGWFQLCARGVGVDLTREQAAFLETFWVGSSYPDARIWCNRVASLAGSMRSTAPLALAAANAVAEATIYGRRNEFKAVAFFTRTVEAMAAGASLADCIDEHLHAQGKLPGYGRPIHNGDERIAPMMALAEASGFHDGPHVQLAFAIEEHLRTERGKPLKMNAGALVSAFGADFGFSPRAWSAFLFPGFLAGMQPVYLEALEQPVGAMFAARVDQVDYTGVQARDWAD